MTAIGALASAAVGYAAGTLPSAELVARAIGGADPTKSGTGNPGAANVADLLGRRAGAAVFGLDTGKAVLAGQIGRTLAGPTGANVGAAAAVLGHCFPAQRGFRGGKGVAASFGQMLATFPAYLPVDLALGAVAAKSDFWKRRPVATIGASCGLWTGLAALAAAASSAAIVWRFYDEEQRRASGRPDSTPAE